MRLTLFLLTFLLSAALRAQKGELSLQELVRSTDLPKEKLQGVATRAGFEREGRTALQFRRIKDSSFSRLSRYDYTDSVVVLCETNSDAIVQQFTRELQSFTRLTSNDSARQYQQGQWLVRQALSQTEEGPLYQFRIQKHILPHPSRLQFAEDLLALQSHEYLVAVFGQGHVKKTAFPFSETESNQASVLFPGTPSQVTFIWRDEENYRDIAFLIVGEEGEKKGVSPISRWRSKQGVHIGMLLRDLVALNGDHLNIFGWESENPGYLTRQNKGQLDFAKLGLQLQWLYCKEDEFYSRTPIIGSAALLSDGCRIYVSRMIILP